MMKTVLKDVLNKMEGKASQGKLLKLDPLDGGSNKVLNLIVSTPGIENPRDEFVLNIIQRSQNKLSKQIGMHEKNILEAVRTGNIPMVEWKINEMIKLAEISNLHVNDYQEKLEDKVKKVFKKVKEFTGNV